ncbi:MAG: DNA alkylation repair protein [Clostridia bacterium]|jgi:3-methyladenine DNA glycosylase AlkD|nr:DNA alkylation repair protein [Clostridia bacterium]
MLPYDQTLAWLYAHADETYREFHKKLLKDPTIQVIGVKVPVLRAFAKKWKEDWRKLLTFPDVYYEITFLKCTAVGMLPFREFCGAVDGVVALLDNWATCDCFRAPCIQKHREDFMPYLEKYLKSEREFTRRFGLVTLLHSYMSEAYLPLIFKSIREACGREYYVTMAAAWLLAEVLVKFYDEGIAFLRETDLSKDVRLKAVQKARESYRLTSEQKSELLQYKNQLGKIVDKHPKIG